MVALSHSVEGEGFPLLMGSSLGTDQRLWARIAGELADGHRVIRYDHRGHGQSPVPEGDYTLEQLAADALELMDSLGIACADYCGVSMGGMVGMWLAAHHPSRIRRLVLACTSAHMPPLQTWIDRAALVRSAGMAAILAPTLERWLTPEFLAADTPELALIRDQFLGTDPYGYAGCAMAVGAMDLRDDLASITAPALVIVAEEDPSTGPEQGEFIANEIPHSELMRISGRHLACIEDPHAVLPAIEAFLMP
ncbi:MAG: 3-oxoadipate enol-lactonase [Actinomycetes bacterium]